MASGLSVCEMASTHAFWTPDLITPGLITLKVFTYPVSLDKRPFLRRLRRENMDYLISHTLEIVLETAYEVHDLAWDESGQLCILVRCGQDMPSIIMLLDFA